MDSNSGLVWYIAKKYYRFLFKGNRDDIKMLANSIDFLACGKMDTRELSRLIQRHLYKIAKNAGWKRNTRKNKSWYKEKKLYEETL